MIICYLGRNRSQKRRKADPIQLLRHIQWPFLHILRQYQVSMCYFCAMPIGLTNIFRAVVYGFFRAVV